MSQWKDLISGVYYTIGGVAFILAAIRILFGWFRDFDNATKFSGDMALIHLPYIYNSLNKIADRLDVPLEPPPLVKFSDHSQA